MLHDPLRRNALESRRSSRQREISSVHPFPEPGGLIELRDRIDSAGRQSRRTGGRYFRGELDAVVVWRWQERFNGDRHHLTSCPIW